MSASIQLHDAQFPMIVLLQDIAEPNAYENLVQAGSLAFELGVTTVSVPRAARAQDEAHDRKMCSSSTSFLPT